MAVSRRLRFEILLRDNHTCRYCGAKAPDVEMTVDHVLPVALGGTDDPGNLVAACKDCNGGKAASTPGAPLLAQVAADADRWAAAIKEVARRRAIEKEVEAKKNEVVRSTWVRMRDRFHDRLCRHHRDGCEFAMPLDWQDTMRELRTAGMTNDDFWDAIKQTFTRDFYVRSRWRYFCGCILGMIRARQTEAAALIADGFTIEG